MVWYFIVVYIINRTLHGCLQIRNFSSRVEKYFSPCSLRSLVKYVFNARREISYLHAAMECPLCNSVHYNQEIVIKMFVLIFQDEFSHLVQEWNTQRMNALLRTFNQMLYPLFEKELKLKLLEEAKNFVVKVSLSSFGADNERSGVLTVYPNHQGGNLVYMLLFNFILGSNFLFFCFNLIIMLLSYITIPKNKRKENLNQG